MLAIVAPGQGSQSVGMLSAWLEDPKSRQSIAEWSQRSGLDLATLGVSGSAEEITNTAIAQPLIVSAGLLSAAALGAVPVAVYAGHSVGEITAASLTGVLSHRDAMRLVTERGKAMAQAASADTGMSAVLGGDREEVVRAITDAQLVAANENGGGQIVAAGLLSALAKLSENPPAGARVRPLAVAGAFHTSFMAPARTQIEKLVPEFDTKDPHATLLSNFDGRPVANGDQALSRIVQQIAHPVRWDLCMATLAEMGVTGVIELAPGGTLTGLLKRAVPNIESLAIKNPADIPAAQEFAAKHADSVVAK